MKVSSSSIKKFLIFSQKKSFLTFQETEIPKKNYCIFLKESFSYISGNGNPKKFLMFQEMQLSYVSGSNFQSSKNKKNPLLIRRNNNKIDSIENWC